MRDTKSIGNTCEGTVLAAMIKARLKVLMPFGEDRRYDLAADVDGRLVRVQCKNGRLRNGVICFNCCSSHYHRGGTSKSYRGEADFFGVYCPETDKVYFVPVDKAPTGKGYLRVDPARSVTGRKSMMARDYEFAGIVQLEERDLGTIEVTGSTPVAGSRCSGKGAVQES